MIAGSTCLAYSKCLISIMHGGYCYFCSFCVTEESERGKDGERLGKEML